MIGQKGIKQCNKISSFQFQKRERKKRTSQKRFWKRYKTHLDLNSPDSFCSIPFFFFTLIESLLWKCLDINNNKAYKERYVGDAFAHACPTVPCNSNNKNKKVTLKKKFWKYHFNGNHVYCMYHVIVTASFFSGPLK